MQDNRRYYSLDALRGSMMMLGIMLHGSIWYISEPVQGNPLPSDQSTSYVFDILFYFVHSFRMPIFFIMAGFFTSLLINKRGVKGTYINRGKRIFGPLLISIFTILPLSLLFMLAFLVSARFNTHQLFPNMEQLEIIGQEMADAGFPNEPPLGHLWFLYYLLYFYLAIPLCIAIVRWCRPIQSLVDNWLAKPVTFIVLGIYTAVTLWPYKGGQVFEGFLYITPHIPSLIYYGSFFILGYLFHDHRKILNTFKEHIPWFGMLSLVLFPLSIYVSNLEFSTQNPSVLLHGSAVLVHGFCTWALIYTITGLFLRYLDYESPWILYISQSSYWVYLIHMPVVSFAAWFMLAYDLHVVVKFPIVLLFTVVVCFSTYHYLVQRTWVSVLLNGRRFNLNWPWQAKPQPGML